MDKDAISPLLSDLHWLTVLAQTLSYTRTAERLGVSKATVSTRMADLERAVGLPLVLRTTRSVVLTDAGMQLVNATRASFLSIEESLSSVRDQVGSPRGLVRVTAPVALGRQHLAAMLISFSRLYPEVRVDLDLSDRVANLAKEGFDLAVRHINAPPETHVAWELCETRSVLAASPAYLRKRGVPTHPTELAGHDCLLYLRDGGTQRWAFERRPAKAGKSGPTSTEPERVAVPVNGPLKVNNSEVLREAIEGGLGIGLLPDFSVSGKRSSALKVLLPDWQPVGFFGGRIYALRPWSPQVPRAVTCLVEHLRTSFRAGFSEGAGAARSQAAGRSAQHGS